MSMAAGSCTGRQVVRCDPSVFDRCVSAVDTAVDALAGGRVPVADIDIGRPVTLDGDQPHAERRRMRTSLDRSCASRSSTGASRSAVSSRTADQNRAAGASRLATGRYTRSGRSYVGPSGMSEPAPWPVQVDSQGIFPTKFSRERTEVLDAGLRRASTILSRHPVNIADADSCSRTEHSVTFAAGVSPAL